LKLPIGGVLAAAQLALNRLLDKRLFAPLAGLALKLQSPHGHLFVLPDENGLHLKQDWQGAVDCCLFAPAPAWLALLTADDKAARIQAPPFECQGKVDLPLQLLSIVQSQPLELAHELSRLAGPLPAALLENILRCSRRLNEQAHSRLQQAFSEYLTSETSLLPHRGEIGAFFPKLTELQQHLNTLEQRVNAL